MTDQNVGGPGEWLFYDGDCSVCIFFAKRYRGFLSRLGFRLAPLQTPWVRQALRAVSNAPFPEMRLLLSDGQTPGGADAILEIARRTVWGWPLVWLAAIPGIKPLLRAAYRELAKRRYCVNGSCSISALQDQPLAMTARGVKIRHWMPLITLVVLAISFRFRMAPWIFMWAVAGAIFLGFKWITLQLALQLSPAPRRSRILAYLFLWPGMDARPFLKEARAQSIHRKELELWLLAAIKTCAGALVVPASATLTSLHPLVRGWLGMLGIVMFLHFGIFDLLRLAFNKRGVPVQPIMRRPLLAASPADFWGKRWNTAFNQLARNLFLLPLRPSLGIKGAVICVFVISGLLHELVISLPAQAGYGLPTLYFLLQGIAVLTERSKHGSVLGLDHGWRGRVFAVFVAAGPAFCLFHPPFINNVILPMLNAIEAI